MLTPAARESVVMISKLQRLNCYEQMVRRLTKGHSANDVAHWAFDLKVEGAEGTWSYLYWRKHIQALARQVHIAKHRLAVKDRRRLRHPVPPEPAAMVAQVEAQVAADAARDPIPESAREVWRDVGAALESINVEHLLKVAAVEQLDRLGVLKRFEKAAGLPLSYGHNEIDSLRAIGDSLLKMQIGERLLRGKGGMMPLEPQPSLPAANEDPTSEIAAGMRTFNEVDRNLIREATMKFVEMVQEVPGGRFKVIRLDADPGGSPETAVADYPAPTGKDVAEGAAVLPPEHSESDS
jgi:hypothetical protein